MTQNKRQGNESLTVAQQVTTENINTRKRISFAQLKHAVSSNLPCFHVQWPPDTDRKKIPSAICASELISKELKINGVEINGFTLVGWAGRKLKLGVNNKVDYATLVATDKWPAKINGIDIEVIKPKYTPDAFVLVIRYVPQELDEEFVANEIQRTIASANHTSRIRYNYKRKTSDYRFEVKDYQEYQSILKLGRIAIGYSWLSVTPFYPGNRLTYCTKCWCIGHLRNHCNSSAKCRICLEMLTENSLHICKKEPNCAQCNGKHYSLDNQCQVIRDYKLQLKVDVEEAINSGKLHRILPKEKAPTFELREQDFPALATNTVSQPPKWNIVQGLMSRIPNTTTAPESEMSVGSINDNLLKLLDSNKRIEEKVDRFKIDLKVVTLDTQLHQAVLLDVIETMKDFTQKFIPSSLTYNKNDRASLIPVVQQFYNRFCYAAMSLNDGFQLNRKVSHAPSQILSNNIIQPTAIMPTTENL
ncbi:unnamed protein product [Rotaria sp. Silwood1]|nr:unnamed protein product [Rotaria sp. Silwood1]